MKKLVFFTVLAMLISSAGWAYVNVDEGFEGYNLDVLCDQPDKNDPYYDPGTPDLWKMWTGVNWATNSVSGTVLYEADALPGTGWTADGMESLASVDGGFLTINDDSTASGTQLTYKRTIDELSNARGTTITFRAKCTDYLQGLTQQTVVLSDGVQETKFHITKNKAGFDPASNGGASDVLSIYAGSSAWVDITENEFHTYIITTKYFGNEQRTMVYIDGSLTPNIAVVMKGRPTALKQVEFGAFSGSGKTTLVIDYIKIQPGGAYPNNAGIPYVVEEGPNPGPTWVDQCAKWQSIGAGGTEGTVRRQFPMNWTTGNAQLYASIKIDGTAKPGMGGNFCYLRMRDSQNRETVRFYIDRNNHTGTNPEGGQLAILGTGEPAIKPLVANPLSGQWYHIKLDVNIDARTYSAYVRTDPQAEWELKYADAGWVPIEGPSTGLKSVEWTMYEHATLWDGPMYVLLDDVRVEGPDKDIPMFTLPAADCGHNPQFRYFTTRPTFEWESDTSSAYHLKVFTKTQVEASGFDPAGSTAYWDSGATTDTTHSVQYPTSPALEVSDLANPPSKIYYVFGRIKQDQSGNWGNWSSGVDFVVSNITPVAPDMPTITSPTGNVTVTTPPVVDWTGSGIYDQSRIIVTRLGTPNVQYCDTNWMSGTRPVHLASFTSDPLAEGQYQITVQVRRGCLPGEAGYESAAGYGNFTVYDGVAAKPSISEPKDGWYAGSKPVVRFTTPTGKVHTQLQVKICTTNNNASAGVWDTGEISSTLDGANCTDALSTGTNYYAFARVGNPNGWGEWSNVCGFKIRPDRLNDVVSVLHMDEPNLLATANDAFPNTLFSKTFNDVWNGTGVTPDNPSECPGGILRFFDNSTQGGEMRGQRVPINLNYGFTLVTAVRAVVPAGEGESDDPAEGWKSASIIITDDNAVGAGVAVKVRPNGNNSVVSICADGTSGGFWDDYTVATPATDFNIIRITGKTEKYNDPTTVTWKVYVNESPSPIHTKTNTVITAAQFNQGVTAWTTGMILLGQGSYQLMGIYEYDWTAVNCSGPYGPDEWGQNVVSAYVPYSGDPENGDPGQTRPWRVSGGQYNSVADALEAETGIITLTGGNMVINHVAPTSFAVQDYDDPNPFSLKVDATINAAANKNKKLTSVGGLLTSDGITKKIKSPTAPVVGTQTLSSSPVVMSIKALGGSPCITQLGGISVNNVGKLVRIFGTLPANPVYTNNGATQTFFVDDLSGMDWVYDGREDGLPGVLFIVPTSSTATLSAGNVVEVIGISSTETYIDGNTLKTVRKIDGPVINKVGP